MISSGAGLGGGEGLLLLDLEWPFRKGKSGGRDAGNTGQDTGKLGQDRISKYAKVDQGTGRWVKGKVNVRSGRGGKSNITEGPRNGHGYKNRYRLTFTPTST